MAALAITAVCVFKIGHKFVRHLKAVSDPLCYGLSKMPFNKNKQATNQAAPELAANPPVLTNNMSAAPGVVSTASCYMHAITCG
jgi:hypothetical protein